MTEYRKKTTCGHVSTYDFNIVTEPKRDLEADGSLFLHRGTEVWVVCMLQEICVYSQDTRDSGVTQFLEGGLIVVIIDIGAVSVSAPVPRTNGSVLVVMMLASLVA